jgi:hypothetical protein
LPYNRERNHGSISLPTLPKEEYGKGSHGTGQKPDYGGAVPRELVPSPLKSQEKHDGRGRKEGKSDQVHSFDEILKHVSDGWLLGPIRDMDEDEKCGNDPSYRQIDIKRPALEISSSLSCYPPWTNLTNAN